MSCSKPTRCLAPLFAGLLLSAASPALAQGRIKAKSKTPPILKLDHDTATIAYRIKVRPGVPEPGTAITVEVELAQILETPDATFGRRKPINDAEITAVLVGPAGKGKKKKR